MVTESRSTSQQPATRRFIPSSRANPCPCCGRNTDDKCRRSQDAIHCWPGERFGPPPDLRIGQVLTVEGRPWAVVSLRGGFSGSHVVLRPDMGREAFRPAVRATRRRQAAVLEPVLLDLFRRVRAWVQAALAMRELQDLKPAELADARLIVATAAETLQELRPPLLEAKRERPELGQLVRAVEVWAKAINYQRADVERFLRLELGEREVAQ